MAVDPRRAAQYPHRARHVEFQTIQLCGSAGGEYYYLDAPKSNIVTWANADIGEIHITQDEGLLVLEPQVEAVENYSTRLRVRFRTYSTESEGAGNRRHRDYLEDWGLPVSRGEFFLSLPSQWKER
jgi:hypothetical protein